MRKEFNAIEMDDKNLIGYSWMAAILFLIMVVVLQLKVPINNLLTTNGFWLILTVLFPFINAILVSSSVKVRSFYMAYFRKSYMSEVMIYFFGVLYITSSYVDFDPSFKTAITFVLMLVVQAIMYFLIEKR